MTDEREYFFATMKGKDTFIYSSESFVLSEIDIINLIKICMIEARSKSIGKKILEVYKDSTEDREEITKERLKNIGIVENDRQKPTRAKNLRNK